MAPLHSGTCTIIIIVITAMTTESPRPAKREKRVLAPLEPVVCSTAARAVGSAAFRTDCASTHHETRYARLFRS